MQRVGCRAQAVVVAENGLELQKLRDSMQPAQQASAVAERDVCHQGPRTFIRTVC
jgi:hypothetical protein